MKNVKVKIIKKYIVCISFVAVIMLFGACHLPAGRNVAEQIHETAKSLQKIGNSKYLLEDEEIISAGDSTGDWIAITLALSQREDTYDAYLKRLTSYVSKTYEKEGYLHKVKATEYHRISLAMLALGGNPAAIQVGEQTIDLVADGTYRFVGGTPGLQGANGLIYALLVLDAMQYQIPQQEEYTREDIICELLEFHKAGEGFCLDRSLESDIDITAMALQALAPYRGDQKIETVIQDSLSWLSGKMTENGGFSSYGNENAECCAQVILALCALGIDPVESDMFQKKQNLLEGLDDFRLKNGMYCHGKEDGKENLMATYQALLALEAVEALRTEGRWIFDFVKE